MSTRSFIGIPFLDSIRAIYCHFDGYVEGVGATLIKHYISPEKRNALIQLGDLSSLGAEIGCKHDFDNPPRNECNVYGRDREEDGTEYILCKNIEDFINKGWAVGANYLYLWSEEKNTWMVRGASNWLSRHYGHSWTDVAKILASKITVDSKLKG